MSLVVLRDPLVGLQKQPHDYTVLMFQECLSMLEDNMLDRIMNNCEFDYCITKDEATVCMALELLATRCADRLSIVLAYRSENLCRESSTNPYLAKWLNRLAR